MFDSFESFKNKKMSGHWGNERVTVKNLTVAKVDAERNLLFIKGAIPGAKGNVVVVKTKRLKERSEKCKVNVLR